MVYAPLYTVWHGICISSTQDNTSETVQRRDVNRTFFYKTKTKTFFQDQDQDQAFLVKTKTKTLYLKTKTKTFTQRQIIYQRQLQTRMWANAQRDGRPAEHRWRPVFNAEKFG